MKQQAQRSLLGHFLILGSGTFLYLLVGLIGTPILTRLVSPAEYGIRSMLALYSQIGTVICGLGMDQTLVHHFYDKAEFDRQKSLLHTCCRIPFVFAAVLGVISLLLTVLCGQGALISDLFLLCGNILSLLLYRFSTLALRLRYQSGAYSTVQIVQKTVYLLLGVVFVLLIPRKHGQLLIFSSILSTLIAAGLGLLHEQELWKPTKHTVPTQELLKYGAPIMFAGGLHMLFQSMDRLFLRRFCSLSDVGVYSGAWNLIAVFSIVQTSFTTLWTNAALDHHTQQPENMNFYRRGNGCISVLMLTLGAAVVLCKDLVALLLGPQYQAAASLLPFLMFQPILYTISETTAVGIAIRKRPVSMTLVSAGACFANFCGNLLLTPTLGPLGAAISTACSYLVFFALRTALSQRIFPVSYQLYSLSLSLAALAVFSVYGSRHPFSWVQVPMFLGVLLTIGLCYHKDIHFMFQYVIQAIRDRKEVHR